jgi:hypothetical protein
MIVYSVSKVIANIQEIETASILHSRICVRTLNSKAESGNLIAFTLVVTSEAMFERCLKVTCM